MSSLGVRLLAWGVALTLVALPLVGLLKGWIAVDRWPVRSLHIEAPFQHVGAEQIRASVAPLLGAGFFAIDLERIQDSVSALPWVARVEVRKRWPDQVLLRVHEQRPYAHWNHDRLINRNGEVFTVPDAAVLQGLPELSGPPTRLREVLEFYLDVLPRFGRNNLSVVGVRLSERGTWSLKLSDGAMMLIGHNHPQRRLSRFLDTWPTLAAGRGARFEYADLRYSNGYAVRWPSPPDSSAAEPQT